MTRSPEQNRRMRDERHRQILSSAARLFATRGLAATKISDIAATAGMSQGLLYHYFASKEEIFVDIIRRAFTRMNSAARALERQPLTPRQKLEAAAAQLLTGLEQGDDFAWSSTLISQASVSDAVPAAAKAVIRRNRDLPYRVVARIVRAGQADGSIRDHDADELALVFWTTIKGLALNKAADGRRFRAPDPRIVTSIFFREG